MPSAEINMTKTKPRCGDPVYYDRYFEFHSVLGASPQRETYRVVAADVLRAVQCEPRNEQVTVRRGRQDIHGVRPGRGFRHALGEVAYSTEGCDNFCSWRRVNGNSDDTAHCRSVSFWRWHGNPDLLAPAPSAMTIGSAKPQRKVRRAIRETRVERVC